MQPPDPAIRRILDLGCGTARFTAMLGNVYGARIIGVDPSQRMLAQREPATDRLGSFVAANAEALPLGTSTVDLVFLSMVYHHLRPEAAVAEIARVVRPRGAVLVRTPTLDTVAAFEYMRFFPAALAFDRARMPDRPAMEATFVAAGLQPTAHRVVMHRFAGSYAEYYAKVSQRALSSLAAIPDDAFARGLVAFERHCREAEDRPIYKPIELFLFRA
jgi:ubiquinone/menaquinone biosynthesis C-methylase UbiE